MPNEEEYIELQDEQTESAAGGQLRPFRPVPVYPDFNVRSATSNWTEIYDLPAELGGGIPGCPKPGCDSAGMAWEANYCVDLPVGFEPCYLFTCPNCKAHYAKIFDTNRWFIEK